MDKISYDVFFGRVPISQFSDSSIDEKKYNTIWTKKVSDIEIVAGMLAASVRIVYEMNQGSKDYLYFVDSNADVSKYRLLNNIHERQIKNHSFNNLKNYAVWMTSQKPSHYDLYEFLTPAFFFGVITLCSFFDTDFTDYLFKFPFDSEGRQYSLPGYHQVDNFDTLNQTFDLNDIEDEEEDDENIIEPLGKDY